MPATESIPKETSLRLHPRLGSIFQQAEARHFKDEELEAILHEAPDRAPEVAAIRAIRQVDVAIINRVVQEVFSQYDYEAHHDFATAKCPRDVRYVVAYACAATLAHDLKWFEDKLLIWMKTILASFNFPPRKPEAVGGLFADEELEAKLAKLPQKTQSTYHCYYRLRQEMQKELAPEHFRIIEPALTLALETLTEPY